MSQRPAVRTAGDAAVCGARRSGGTVLVAVRHQAMRRFTREILEYDCGCMVVGELAGQEMLAEALASWRPDLLVIDTGDFPSCCRRALEAFPAQRVIVVGPEPAADYRTVAMAQGAGGWIPRDRLAEDLPAEVRRLLGCRHTSAESAPPSA